MKNRLDVIFGFGGTGFVPLSVLKSLDYHGKVRVMDLIARKVYRPQSAKYDFIHIIGTRGFGIFGYKTINIK